MMKTLSDWNRRQCFVMERYCRARTLAMTPELVKSLAIRFARKHGAERRCIGEIRRNSPK